ncbi:PDZ domain-containing protein [Sulfitobacter faviae]|uniref:PDZ domain-containing protein n=1 Tax=Sulfitobacter faviae TaxID=1775881 RepID=UPI003B43CEC9
MPGDVIAAIDGRAVRTSDDIRDALDAYAPGDRVAISLLRDGSELETSVVLASPQPD